MIGILEDDEMVEIVDLVNRRRFTGLGKRYVADNPTDELKKVTTVKNRLILYVEQDGET